MGSIWVWRVILQTETGRDAGGRCCPSGHERAASQVPSPPSIERQARWVDTRSETTALLLQAGCKIVGGSILHRRLVEGSWVPLVGLIADQALPPSLLTHQPTPHTRPTNDTGQAGKESAAVRAAAMDDRHAAAMLLLQQYAQQLQQLPVTPSSLYGGSGATTTTPGTTPPLSPFSSAQLSSTVSSKPGTKERGEKRGGGAGLDGLRSDLT